ncbi:MAG: energy transducer TonB [Cryomorphaceae bacterium]
MKKTFQLLFLGLTVSFCSFGQQTNANNASLSSNPDSVVYTSVPVMPEFGKNEKALQKFIKNESKIKVNKSRTETSRNVFVQIVVEKDGSVTFDKIARGVNDQLNTEARRIVENMPNWTPGKLKDGSNPRVVMMFPIWFK